MIETIPEPVFYNGIEFYYPGEGTVNYTDCWEISVYRFLHLVFSKDGKIQVERLLKFMEPERYQCQILLEFFKKYPNVMRTNEEY